MWAPAFLTLTDKTGGKKNSTKNTGGFGLPTEITEKHLSPDERWCGSARPLPPRPAGAHQGHLLQGLCRTLTRIPRPLTKQCPWETKNVAQARPKIRRTRNLPACTLALLALASWRLELHSRAGKGLWRTGHAAWGLGHPQMSPCVLPQRQQTTRAQNLGTKIACRASHMQRQEPLPGCTLGTWAGRDRQCCKQTSENVFHSARFVLQLFNLLGGLRSCHLLIFPLQIGHCDWCNRHGGKYNTS